MRIHYVTYTQTYAGHKTFNTLFLMAEAFASKQNQSSELLLTKISCLVMKISCNSLPLVTL